MHLKLVVDSETIESDISQTKCLIKLIADTMKSYIRLANNNWMQNCIGKCSWIKQINDEL